MKIYWRVLLHTLIPVLLGLVAGCVLTGLSTAIFTVPPKNFSNLAASWSLGIFYALWAVALGAIPAFVYGAPLYAFAHIKGRASYISALVIGAVPGLVLLLAKQDALLLAYGAVVAVCTHFFAQRSTLTSLGANNSFKPKPLRGSA